MILTKDSDLTKALPGWYIAETEKGLDMIYVHDTSSGVVNKKNLELYLTTEVLSLYGPLDLQYLRYPKETTCI